MVEKLDIYNRNKIRTGKIVERKAGIKLNKGGIYFRCSMLDYK